MTMAKRFLGVLVLLTLSAGSALAQQTCFGEGDTNGDGIVDPLDSGFILSRFGCTVGGGDANCDRADANDSGVVDPLDVGFVAQRFGRSYLNYGPHRDNLEAEMLAMAISGNLRAPNVQYERILHDLALIRIEFPDLTTVVDDTDYVPNQLIVGVDDSMPLDEFDALNDFYMTIDEDINSWGWVLTFCDNLNAVALSLAYAALPEIQWAEPNYLIGIDDYFTVTPSSDIYHYSIDDGFWDCFDGCDCHRYWEIDVAADGTVTLISYTEAGQSWCEFD